MPIIVPAIDPFCDCAAACGARTVTNARSTSTANIMDFKILFMLFLLLPRRTLPGLAGGMALLSSILALFQVGQTFPSVLLVFSGGRSDPSPQRSSKFYNRALTACR